MKDIPNWLKYPRLRQVYLPYTALVILILGPLLLPGYILTLDMVFVPHPPLPGELSSSYVFHALLHFISYVIPSDVCQKLILGATLFLAGYGAHRLIERLRPSKGGIWTWIPYFAGLLYLFNPFVYERFITGQYSVLMGYALVPWFVRSLLEFLQRPSIRSCTPVMLWVIAISIVSIHTIGPLVVVSLVAVGVTLWKRRANQAKLLATLGYSAVIAGGALVLSSYWLVPTLLGHGPIADATESFNNTQFAAFATQGGLFGVMQLHGFWAEGTGLFIPHDDPLPFSGLWQLCLWILTTTGVIAAWRRQRALALIFLVSAAAAALLALGVFQDWLVAHIPLFAGYREPQKFVMLIALSNSYFGGWGIAAIITTCKKHPALSRTILTTSLILPILITPTLVWGLYNQLHPHDYPKDWYTISATLSNKEDRVLFLPWHLYMRFSFAGGRLLASPADQFFSPVPVVVSDDPEFGGISPQSKDELKSKLSRIFADHPERTLDGKTLQALGIRYILLAHEGDADDYDYINHAKGVQLVKKLPALALYEAQG